MSDNEQILDAVRKYLDNKVRATWGSQVLGDNRNRELGV